MDKGPSRQKGGPQNTTQTPKTPQNPQRVQAPQPAVGAYVPPGRRPGAIPTPYPSTPRQTYNGRRRSPQDRRYGQPLRAPPSASRPRPVQNQSRNDNSPLQNTPAAPVVAVSAASGNKSQRTGVVEDTQQPTPAPGSQATGVQAAPVQGTCQCQQCKCPCKVPKPERKRVPYGIFHSRDSLAPGVVISTTHHKQEVIPPDNESQSKNFQTLNKNNEWVYSKHYPMIIVQCYRYHFVAVPIHTYENDGLEGKSNKNEHAGVRMYGAQNPAASEGEEVQNIYMKKDPFCPPEVTHADFYDKCNVHFTFKLGLDNKTEFHRIGDVATTEDVKRLVDAYNDRKFEVSKEWRP